MTNEFNFSENSEMEVFQTADSSKHRNFRRQISISKPVIKVLQSDKRLKLFFKKTAWKVSLILLELQTTLC